jgi:TPR repeat protein
MSLKYDPEPTLAAFDLENYDAALRLALPHADAGNSDSQCMVALLYETGLGLNRDVLKAESRLIKAAEQNSCVAWNNLGTH